MIKNWIFLRGLNRGAFHWADLIQRLPAEIPDCEIEFLEIPGNGELCQELTPTDPLQLVEVLRKQSQFVRQGKKFGICGISLGGMLALKWADLHPEEVSQICVINSSLPGLSPAHQRLRLINWMSIFLAVASTDLRQREKKILEITSNHPQRSDWALEKYVDYANLRRGHRINFFRQLLLASRLRIEKEIRVPVVVFASLKDRLVSVDCSKKIAAQFSAKIVLHPTAGHDLSLDDPDWFLEQFRLSLSK